MRHLIVLSVLLFCIFQTSEAQVRDHAIGYGFKSFISDATALTGNRWLAIGRGVETPGATHSDSLFMIMLDEDGTILLRQGLQVPPAEVHEALQVLAIPDGGFVILSHGGGCDYYGYDFNMQRFDSLGQQIWANTTVLASKLAITPDGNLIGLVLNQVRKYDLATGAEIWHAALNNFSSPYIDDFILRPGTEHLVVLGSPDFQYWQQTGAPDTIKYFLNSDYDFQQSSSCHDIQAGPDGWYYTFESQNNRFLRFILGYYWQPVYTPDFYPTDFKVVSNGLQILGRDSIQNHLIKISFTGEVVNTYPITDAWRYGTVLAAKGFNTLIAGAIGSGPQDNPIKPFAWQRAQHAWIRTGHLTLAPEPIDESDASITDIQQQSPLNLDSIVSPFDGTLYKFSGGQFMVQVTNSGSLPIDAVNVMTGFEIEPSICFKRPARRVHYSGLNLAPGASVWLDFGDVEAGRQPVKPTEFCFWTAAPNEQPDADHSNDTHCTSITIQAKEPVIGALRVYPNPSDKGFLVESFAADELPDIYKLYDATGKLVLAGNFPEGASIAFVTTEQVQAGLYWLRAGSRVEKIVVAR